MPVCFTQGMAGLLAVAVAGCMGQQQAPPPVASARPAPVLSSTPLPREEPSPPVAPRSRERTDHGHVYRFDFVLTTKDASGGGATSSFTLNLEESRKGEIMIGKNVALVAATPSGVGAAHAVARQDVGLKIIAQFRPSAGDDTLLEVNMENSSLDPGSAVRKVVTMGSALAPPNKPTLVMSLDDDHKHYDLTVTPTKVR